MAQHLAEATPMTVFLEKAREALSDRLARQQQIEDIPLVYDPAPVGGDSGHPVFTVIPGLRD